LRKATIRFVMSVRPSVRNNSAATRRILIKFDGWDFFRKSSLNYYKSNGYITWCLRTFFISLCILRIQNMAATGRILIQFDIWKFFENLSRKFKFHYSLIRIPGTLHEDFSTFMIISNWFLLSMRNVSDKSCTENRNTRFMSSNIIPKPRVLYEIISKNVVKPERMQTLWRLSVAYWLSKHTRTQAHARAREPTPTHGRTHSDACLQPHARVHTQEYVIFVFPRQQWIREQAHWLPCSY
jgi:hypothetical protein